MRSETQLPTQVAAVLFDMDNTLVASEYAWFAATRQLWEEVGANPEGRGTLGGTVQDVVAEFLAAYPETDSQALATKVSAMIEEQLNSGVRPTPGAEALVRRLSGRIPITIASNSPSRIVTKVVNSLGWDDMFTAKLGTEDVKHPKPAPDIYLAAADKCGVNIADCVIFEDSPMGVTAATASGAFVVTIGAAASGMGDLAIDDLTDQRVIEWTPTAI